MNHANNGNTDQSNSHIVKLTYPNSGIRDADVPEGCEATSNFLIARKLLEKENTVYLQSIGSSVSESTIGIVITPAEFKKNLELWEKWRVIGGKPLTDVLLEMDFYGYCTYSQYSSFITPREAEMLTTQAVQHSHALRVHTELSHDDIVCFQVNYWAVDNQKYRLDKESFVLPSDYVFGATPVITLFPDVNSKSEISVSVQTVIISEITGLDKYFALEAKFLMRGEALLELSKNIQELLDRFRKELIDISLKG